MVSSLERLLYPKSLPDNHGHAVLCTLEGFPPADWLFLGPGRAEVGFVGGEGNLLQRPEASFGC